jgi:hypothetical protein
MACSENTDMEHEIVYQENVTCEGHLPRCHWYTGLHVGHTCITINPFPRCWSFQGKGADAPDGMNLHVPLHPRLLCRWSVYVESVHAQQEERGYLTQPKACQQQACQQHNRGGATGV